MQSENDFYPNQIGTGLEFLALRRGYFKNLGFQNGFGLYVDTRKWEHSRCMVNPFGRKPVDIQAKELELVHAQYVTRYLFQIWTNELMFKRFCLSCQMCGFFFLCDN